jgi:large subunit ribosomal protein L25
MASQSPAQYIQLAKTLPPRLLRFLARYPPATIQANASATATPTGYQQDTPNPFKATKHPVTGQWHDPVYSLRRQAELVKIARDYGVVDLLPESDKNPETKLRKRVEFGLRIKGTGVGQSVKGHQYERRLIAKMDERRNAMLNMPKLIREWKRVSFASFSSFCRSITPLTVFLGWPQELGSVPELIVSIYYTLRYLFFYIPSTNFCTKVLLPKPFCMTRFLNIRFQQQCAPYKIV